MDIQLPDYSLRMMLPELFLFAWALVVLTVDVITKRRSGAMIGYLTMIGIAISGAILSTTGYGQGFGTMFINDPMALFFKVIFLGSAFMAVGSSFGITSSRIVNHRGEYFGLILFSTVGMMFLSSSQELLSLYIGLELTTVPLFVLAAFFKDDRRSVEAGIKYLIIGALSSALLLFGLSYLFGLSGTTDIVQMRVNLAITQLHNEGNIGVILILATVCIVSGLGFKLALPPFHQWAPDVYEGSPTPIAAFLSVGSKAAGLVAFAKIMLSGLFAFYDSVMKPNDWGLLVGILAAAAMIWGNIAAIRQTNIKRLLAYSSIAQVGYILIGMLSLNHYGLSSVGYYMFIYLFANMGAFAAVTVFEDQTGSCEIESYNGLSKSSPFLAAALAIFFLSLAGIPPLAGFFAKYFVFAAAISQASKYTEQQWLYWLVGIGLATSVVSLYYYAKVIKATFFTEPTSSPVTIRYNAPAMAVLLIGLTGVVVFGLFPEPVIRYTSEISSSFGFLAP